MIRRLLNILLVYGAIATIIGGIIVGVIGGPDPSGFWINTTATLLLILGYALYIVGWLSTITEATALRERGWALAIGITFGLAGLLFLLFTPTHIRFRKCPKCKGTGKEYVPCPRCRGFGFHYGRPDGTFPNYPLICDMCDGKREISSRRHVPRVEGLDKCGQGP